eukprot:4634927-Ditylum_brightwellii.AAC.1
MVMSHQACWADVLFCNAILVVGIDTPVRYGLFTFLDVMQEVIIGKVSIVTGIVLDMDFMLAHVYVSVPPIMVNKEHGDLVLSLGEFALQLGHRA